MGKNCLIHMRVVFPLLIFIGLFFLVLLVTPDIEQKMKPHATVNHIEISELSGIIRAEKPGEYWGINDRGNRPALYRFSLQGRPLQTVTVSGVSNYDWEAITRDRQGNLYIGDIGDNNEVRKHYSVLRVPPPDSTVKVIRNVEQIDFRYPKKVSQNSEAMFFYQENLYIISKESKENKPPTLFRLNSMKTNGMNYAVKVGSIQVSDRVSDAAVSSDGKNLAILADNTLYITAIKSEKELLHVPMYSKKIDFGNCEGICFDEGNLIISNEIGNLWSFPVQHFFDQ